MRWRPLLLGFVVLISGAPHDAPAQQNQTFVRIGHLVDIERGRALQNQLIVIDGERIERIGPVADIRIPCRLL